MLDRLSAQLKRVVELLAAANGEALDRASPFAQGGDDRTLGHCALHGWHDETRHQGEMYLLLKVQRLGPGRSGGEGELGEPPGLSRGG